MIVLLSFMVLAGFGVYWAMSPLFDIVDAERRSLERESKIKRTLPSRPDKI